MKDEITREYTDGTIRVIWREKKCQHAGRCVAGLPQVFNPQMRPWVDMSAASTGDIIAVVEQCPSGALIWESEP